jgi:hypothetical protein
LVGAFFLKKIDPEPKKEKFRQKIIIFPTKPRRCDKKTISMAEYIHEIESLNEKFSIRVSQHKSKIVCMSTNRPFCNCLTNLNELRKITVDEHFPSLSPCPNNCRKLEHCKYHQDKMLIQTTPTLIGKGINCVFCHINDGRELHTEVKDLNRSK